MTVKNLYVSKIKDGLHFSLLEPEEKASLETIKYRLIADEGKVLTKNNIDFFSCIDVEQSEYWNDEWQEISNKDIII